MDRTAVIVVTICVILLFWTWPSAPVQNQQVDRINSTNSPNNTITESSPKNVEEKSILPEQSTSAPPVKLESEKLVSLKTKNSIFTFTSLGGLKSVGLLKYKAKPCSTTNTSDIIIIIIKIKL